MRPFNDEPKFMRNVKEMSAIRENREGFLQSIVSLHRVDRKKL